MEKVLFRMPILSGEAYLAALTVVQRYRDLYKCDITFVRRKNFSWLDSALGRPGAVTPSEEHIKNQVNEFDFVFDFNVANAMEIAKPTEKHLVKAFSAMLGVGVIKETPSLAAVNIPIVEYDVCLLPWWGQETIANFLALNKPEYRVICLTTETLFLESTEVAEIIKASSMVIGPRSYATYIAASIKGRLVVELYPDDTYRTWLSKWTCPTYQMVYGKLEHMTPILVWRGMEGLWASHRLCPVVDIKTAQ